MSKRTKQTAESNEIDKRKAKKIAAYLRVANEHQIDDNLVDKRKSEKN